MPDIGVGPKRLRPENIIYRRLGRRCICWMRGVWHYRALRHCPE